MNDSPLDQLVAALAAAEHVIGGVRPDQWAAATPCSEWTARDLIAHLVGGNHLFANALRGEELAAPASSDGDPLVAYQDSASALRTAFGEPGALDRVITVPFGTVPGMVALHLRIIEALVHGWDLARATGQPAAFPDDLAEQDLAFTRDKLADIPPGHSPFGPPQPVDDDAPAIDRLVACLGRDPRADHAGSGR